jgi:enamine deaminase RidA (YjgF/YER057c/UK114 family)
MTRPTPALALLLAITLVGCGPTTAQMPPGMTRGIAPTSSVPEAIVAPSVPVLEGLPQAVRVGLTVYLSGMVPVDSAGRLIGPGDVRLQAQQAVANLVAVVRAAKGVPGDIVKITVYVKDVSPEAVASIRTAVLDGLDRGSPPALTIIGVAALPEPAMRVMLDGVAQLRSEFPDRTRMGTEGAGRGGRGGRGGD